MKLKIGAAVLVAILMNTGAAFAADDPPTPPSPEPNYPYPGPGGPLYPWGPQDPPTCQLQDPADGADPNAGCDLP